MAQIGLREYDRDIESMIDRGQIDEAIAHCKNIFKEFPKHIETYRLLGKMLPRIAALCGSCRYFAEGPLSLSG